MDEQKLAALEALLKELQEVLAEIRDAKEGAVADTFQPSTFFNSIRPLFSGGKLTASQVAGMEAKLKVFREAKYSIAHTAYSLATSFHETAQRMQPVREGLGASESWRRAHLRYYPYYGRGDVQLTWLANYEKADRALGLGGSLIQNLDQALDPTISAEIMVKGMTEGWFARDSKGPHTLARHIPSVTGTLAQFRTARRIINGTDKADVIAKYAIAFQEALKKANY